MARPRKTQTKVTLNAKISNVDLQTIPYDGSVAFIEGAPVKYGATGVAAQPTGGATVGSETIYVNFVDSTRTDVIDSQGDPFQDDLSALNLGDSGHLTGIRGSGLDIGLPASCWHGGVLPAVGEGVIINATSKLWEGSTVAVGEFYYGIVERIEGDRAHFFFTSRPIPGAEDVNA